VSNSRFESDPVLGRFRERLNTIDNQQVHHIAWRVCKSVAEDTEIGHLTAETVDLCKHGSEIPRDLAENLKSLAGDADCEYLDILDSDDLELAHSEACLTAFAKSRCLAAVAFLCQGSRESSFEAIYEAYHASAPKTLELIEKAIVEHSRNRNS
jgi:hypothetical protein